MPAAFFHAGERGGHWWVRFDHDRILAVRVVVPYTSLTRGCTDCLDQHAPHAELAYVGDDPLDYWRLVCRVWGDGQGFILIEQDQEFDADVIPTLEACPHDVCRADGWFRFVKFGAARMRAEPEMFEGMPTSQRHWLVLENFASKRLGSWHSHIADLGVAHGGSGTRHIDQNVRRRAVWFEWLRTLGPEHADEWTAKAWRVWEQTACRRDGCRRAPAGVRHRVFTGREICLDGRWCPYLTTEP